MSDDHARDQAQKPWQVTCLTLFPEMFPATLGHSLAGKALKAGRWGLETVDIRSFATDRHGTVDDTPYGGGAGMVLKPDVVDRAIAESGPHHRLIYMSPRGRLLDQPLARELADGEGCTIICGRYEGLDQRVLDANAVEEVSIGDYIVSGGEIAAQVLIDTVVRLLPAVIGNAETHGEESFTGGLLEYPHYTRPAVWTDRQGTEHPVPPVLTSGDHGAVKRWRLSEAEAITRQRRPDLWSVYRGTDTE
ncbi:MAG: tRNA (guanosine(37)-N1)-methyltransferase TrmD [Alphaproteobacteria bacterium]|nr:tRNA (guanosine(37)-N1)-methyltransferase TrmD [Alphaproteobacteria bacterium SS10]